MSAKSEPGDLYAFDKEIAQETPGAIVGLDEVGRGPLAGPVVAAAVILDGSRPIEGLDDSKKLSPRKREYLYTIITTEAVAWAVAECSPEEIDKLNILRASLTAMKRALDQIQHTWSLALIDGNQLLPDLARDKQRCVVKGDAASASIAAASVVAKVTRDRQMTAYSDEFPVYEFGRHMGYPTALHRGKIQEHGICGIHRKSFCRKILTQTTLPL